MRQSTTWKVGWGGIWPLLLAGCAGGSTYGDSSDALCSVNNGGCNVNATCTASTTGSSVCTCKAGYAGSGLTCSKATTVSAGQDHTCSLKTDGTLWCWGDNQGGQMGPTGATSNPAKIGTANTWATISAGSGYSCGIQTNGTLWCWGANQDYQLGLGNRTFMTAPTQVGTNTNWASISTGFGHNCGIQSDGSLWCWGDDASGQQGAVHGQPMVPTVVAAGTHWTAVATGTAHTCGIQQGGTLWCWGDNSLGQLGLGTTIDGEVAPTRVGTATTWASLSAHQADHTCAIQTNGTLWCWGNNTSNQLGFAGVSAVPKQVSGAKWTNIAVNESTTCGTQNNGTLWCWGANGMGQAGIGTFKNPVATPTRVGNATNWSGVSAGRTHTCGIQTTGVVSCWGDNSVDQLGTGLTSSSTPVRVGTLPWRAVSAGLGTCAIEGLGVLGCWGDNFDSQLGTGNALPVQTPVVVGGVKLWTSVSMNVAHGCGVQTNGTLWCWGTNTLGGVGNGTTTTVLKPSQIGTSFWRSASTGDLFTCGIQTNGSLWCWGDNSMGELGLGTVTATSVLVPTRVGTDTTWASISSGTAHACGLQTNGTLWCWGDNSMGELGDGTLMSHSAPEQIGTVTDWSAVAAGNNATCALEKTGALWCWGSNTSGQVALDPALLWGQSAPVQVLTGVKQLAGMSQTFCAIKTNGTLWCWGADGEGQAGDGVSLVLPVSGYTLPKQVGTATNWTAVSSGLSNTCGIQSGGALWCWGSNVAGGLGTGTVWKATPVPLTF